MINNYNNDRLTAGTTLLGGIAGAGAGYLLAPSVLGKVDIDAVLQRKVDTDIVRDRILREIGEASKDSFVKSRDIWYNNESFVLSGIRDIYTSALQEGAKECSVKQLKEVLNNNNSNNVFSREQLNNYRNLLDNYADDVKFDKNSLEKLFVSESIAYKNAKMGIKNLIDNVPKQRGKYAIIVGVVGALSAMLLAKVFGSKKQA